MSSSDTQQGWEQVAVEAERLCEAASEADWTVMPNSSGGMTLVRGNSSDLMKRHPQTHLQIVPTADARFIARARSLVPELAALVRQQAAEVARLRAERDQYLDFADRLNDELADAAGALQEIGKALNVPDWEGLPLHRDKSKVTTAILAALTPLAAGEAEGA